MNNQTSFIENIDFSNYNDCKIICDRANTIFRLSSNSGIEYAKIINFLHNKKLNSFIEIGSAYGSSFLIWSSIINGIKISIDLPTDMNMGIAPYPLDLSINYIKDVRNKLWESWYPNEVHSIIGDSHSENTVKIVSDILKNKKVDFLFVDGEHTQIAANTDFENYVKFVNVGGYIAFHDIQINDERKMDIFWNEISQKYENYVFDAGVGLEKIGLIKI
jgi:cephalosporin hydroxylase